MFFCLLGGVFIWGTIGDGAQRWWMVAGAAFVMCGLWFIWSAAKPHRQDVADICTTIVDRLLEAKFWEGRTAR